MFVSILLFLLGVAIGSFLNVVALRFDPDADLTRPSRGGGVFGRQLLGRSRCPRCAHTLAWFELIPIVSFAAQMGRCRSCGGKISLQYPAVELLSGAALTLAFAAFGFTLEAAIFALAAFAFIVISLIDIRHYLIPDVLVALIVLLAVARLFSAEAVGNDSFLGHYALIAGAQGNIWLNRLVAAVSGGGALAMISVASRGRAMGWGDVKLAAAGGVLLGWPDIIFALTLAFVSGSLASVALVARGEKAMRDVIPFGPFIALGIILTMFLGYDMLNGYLGIFGLA